MSMTTSVGTWSAMELDPNVAGAVMHICLPGTSDWDLSRHWRFECGNFHYILAPTKESMIAFLYWIAQLIPAEFELKNFCWTCYLFRWKVFRYWSSWCQNWHDYFDIKKYMIIMMSRNTWSSWCQEWYDHHDVEWYDHPDVETYMLQYFILCEFYVQVQFVRIHVELINVFPVHSMNFVIACEVQLIVNLMFADASKHMIFMRLILNWKLILSWTQLFWGFSTSFLPNIIVMLCLARSSWCEISPNIIMMFINGLK